MKRIILRTSSNLSFCGLIVKEKLFADKKGILLKTNSNLNLKVWVPIEEIKCIFVDGNVIEGEKILDYIYI